jgi:hypothetical protein
MTDQLAATDHLRVSDAERHEVGRLLGRHFADGRLDEAELDDRLAAAMSARTRGDLRSLFADLPRLGAAAPPAGRPPIRSRWLAAVAAGLVALLVPATLLAHARAEQMARFPLRFPGGIEMPLVPAGGRHPSIEVVVRGGRRTLVLVPPSAPAVP